MKRFVEFKFSDLLRVLFIKAFNDNMRPVIKIDTQMLSVYDNVEPKTRKFLKKKILNYALDSNLWKEPIIIDDNLIENVINL